MSEYIGYILAVAIVLGLSYTIIKKTGIEDKLRRIRKKQLEQIKAGWGVEELRRLTKLNIEEQLSLGKKDGRNLYVGMEKIGKIDKIIKYDVVTNKRNETFYYLAKIKKSLFGSIVYFIFNSNEITNSDNKNVYLIDGIIINKAGVYFLGYNIDNKSNYIKYLIEKMNEEDVYGRISNLASKIIYLDVQHAKAVDTIMKRIEAIERMKTEDRREEISDFISA